jgi:hypothetical protein
VLFSAIKKIILSYLKKHYFFYIKNKDVIKKKGKNTLLKKRSRINMPLLGTNPSILPMFLLPRLSLTITMRPIFLITNDSIMSLLSIIEHDLETMV